MVVPVNVGPVFQLLLKYGVSGLDLTQILQLLHIYGRQSLGLSFGFIRAALATTPVFKEKKTFGRFFPPGLWPRRHLSSDSGPFRHQIFAERFFEAFQLGDMGRPPQFSNAFEIFQGVLRFFKIFREFLRFYGPAGPTATKK